MTLLHIATDISLPEGILGMGDDGNITPEAAAHLPSLVDAHFSANGSEFRAAEIAVLDVDEDRLRVKVTGSFVPKRVRGMGNLNARG